jgi:hypothetical protein
MNLADLGVLYGLAGALSGALVYRAAQGSRVQALGSAALSVPLWPLWLPVLLASQQAEARLPRTATTEAEAALLGGHEAVRDTPLDPRLPRVEMLGTSNDDSPFGFELTHAPSTPCHPPSAS